MLVENYNYLTAPSWSCIGMGIFELLHYLFIIVDALREDMEKRIKKKRGGRKQDQADTQEDGNTGEVLHRCTAVRMTMSY